jgi:uncharacterized protein (UPF0548 family)
MHGASLARGFLLLAWAVSSLAAAFSKRYSSLSADETVLRFNRSRIQRWQRKARQQQRSRRPPPQSSLSWREKGNQPSGTSIFLGKPSKERIAKRFWDSIAPTFQLRTAGELTHPAISATSTVSVTPELDMNTSSDAFLTHNPQEEDEGKWWPPVPFLGIAGSSQTKSRARSLDGSDRVFRYTSSRVLSSRVLRYQLKVGEGTECYERVRDAALAWEFASKDKGIKHVPAQSAGYGSSYGRSVHPLEGMTDSADRKENWGKRLVTWTSVGPFHVLSPVAVVYEWVNQRGSGRDGGGTLFTSCAYSTQKGHWLAGEERVTVALRDTFDTHELAPVEVEIVSISRPAPTLMGRLAWPLIGRLQDKFFVDELRALHQVGIEMALPKSGTKGEADSANVAGARVIPVCSPSSTLQTLPIG